ncbi:MAG: hypothetical protein RIC38_09625, partial [Chromatocurvus sp.]
MVAGNGGYEGNSAVITELLNEEGVLKATRPLNSADYPFLRFRAKGLHPGFKLYLFWRTARAPAELQSTPLHYNGDGTHYANLSKEDKWQSMIIETSIGVFGDLRGESFRLEEVSFLPYGKANLLRTIWTEWTAFEAWDQEFVNAYRGVPKAPIAYPAPTVAALTGGAIFLFVTLQAISRRRSGEQGDVQTHALTGIMILGLMGWGVLDGLWQNKLFRQSAETIHLFAGKSHHEKMLGDWDGEYYAFAHTIKTEYLPNATQKIPVLAMAGVPKAYGFRMEYHLLPEHVALTSGYSYPQKGSDLLSVSSARIIQRAARRSNYFIVLTTT